MTPETLDNLPIDELVKYMDETLSGEYFSSSANTILNLNVKSIHGTCSFQKYDSDFQRKLAYKAYGFLLQIQYTDLTSSVNHSQGMIESEKTKNIFSAARDQWTIVSSRIGFEYFMHLTYMLREGEELKNSKSVLKRYKKWLKV